MRTLDGARWLPLLVLLAVPGAGACATTAAASPPAARAEDAEPAAGDVAVLRERVGRLERRLADVDAKLALLVAQKASGPRTDRSPPSQPVEAPREVVDLTPPGLRAIDIERRESVVAVDELPEVPDVAFESEAAPPPRTNLPLAADGSVLIRLGSEREVRRDDDAGDAPDASPDDLYAWAQGRRKAGDMMAALSGFEALLDRHPRHRLADNALYWAAACHQQRGEHRLAIDTWQRVPIRFPKSAKVPDALFGMALSHEALGEPALAETLYGQLVAQHPRAERVQDARRALARLRPNP